MVLSKNRTFSHLWFLEKSNLKKSFFDTFWKKKMFFRPENCAKKSTFSKEFSPSFLSKNWTFSHQCFLQKLCQKRSFFDILDRKEWFLDQKIEVLKSPKNRHSPKGLIYRFSPKILICVFCTKLCQKRSFSG